MPSLSLRGSPSTHGVPVAMPAPDLEEETTSAEQQINEEARRARAALIPNLRCDRVGREGGVARRVSGVRDWARARSGGGPPPC